MNISDIRSSSDATGRWSAWCVWRDGGGGGGVNMWKCVHVCAGMTMSVYKCENRYECVQA